MTTDNQRYGMSILVVCLLLTCGALLAVTLQGVEQQAAGQLIVPGGIAGRVHVFHLDNTLDDDSLDWDVLIESAPGTPGFLITDVIVSSNTAGRYPALRVDDAIVFRHVVEQDTAGNGSYDGPISVLAHSFRGGIPAPAGHAVYCYIAGSDPLHYTITGIEY